MKRIYLLCLMLCLVACGSETDTSLGMANQPPSVEIKEHEAYRYTVVLANASDAAVITVNDLPSWAEFDPETKLISGVPGHDNANGEYTFSISAVDGEASFQSDDITIKVLHSTLKVLSTPRARTLLKELYPFSHTVSVESDIKQLTFSLDDKPEWMEIKPTTGELSGTPSHAYVDETYTISMMVSDGYHHELLPSFELTITPLINLNPIISVSTNAVGDLYINQNIEINFDTKIEDITSITLDAPNGACISNVQLSDDDFLTCIELEGLYPEPEEVNYENDDTKSEEDNDKLEAEAEAEAARVAKQSFQLSLSTAKLEINKNYKLRVTTFVNEGFDYSLPEDFDSSFYTVSGLMITEIGSRLQFYEMHWLELYNASRSAVNLKNYTLKTMAIKSEGCDTKAGTGCPYNEEHDFVLSDMVIQPGQYVVIRGNDWVEPYENTERTMYIGDGIYPYWYDFGYIELIHSDVEGMLVTEDYVRFGRWYNKDWVHEPISEEAWTGSNFSSSPPVYNQNMIFAGSIGRSGGLTDSNVSVDWQVYESHTAGGANDITDAVTDQDQDGIPDYAEVEGATYAGMSLYDLGARVGKKDIFIELDYMGSSDEGLLPREEALQKVVDAFENQNIAVHFDVGDLFDPEAGINHDKFDLGGGGEVPFFTGLTTYSLDSRADLYDIKRSYMSNARFPIFHYMLMANSQQADGSSGSGGFAERHGNDSAITLGGWELNSNDESSLNALINIQAATIMHELGHNLGLSHGGDEELNFKPNYVSIMNYLYAIDGLPTIGENEGDRYYYEKNYREGDETCGEVILTNPVDGDFNNFIIDYSSEATSMDEDMIFETNGLNLQGSTPVDYNCNGTDDDELEMFDVNFTNNITELTQPSDWESIELKFQKFIRGSFGASLRIRQPNDLTLIEDVVGDDSGEIIYEEPLSRARMERIKAM